MDIESAWRERYCKVDFTFRTLWITCRQNALQRTSSRGMITPRPFDGRRCSMSTGPEGVLIMLICGGELLSPNSQADPGVKSQMSSWIVSAYICSWESSFSNATQPLYGITIQRRRHECCGHAAAAPIRAT